MSLISAKSLFHFTRERNTLISILSTGYRPSYCIEFGPAVNDALRLVEIPMVSFCDLPISDLRNHIANPTPSRETGYGKFGLGMSKEWGIEKGLNPVMYLSTNSSFFKIISPSQSDISQLYKVAKQRAELLSDSYHVQNREFKLENMTDDERSIILADMMLHNSALAFQTILNYCKPHTDAKTGELYYNEREWRYIVDGRIGRHNEVPVLFYNPDSQLIAKKELFKATIESKHMLNFTTKDIKYIIVEKESDIEAIITGLVISNKYLETEVHKLTTRIITYEQIRDDF